MNRTRIAIAALSAFVAYFIVGGIFFVIPAMGAEFANYPSIYRTGDAARSVMAVGMLGILFAIVVAAAIRVAATGRRASRYLPPQISSQEPAARNSNG